MFILYILRPSPPISHLSKELWFFDKRLTLETKVWVLGMLVAMGLSVLLSFQQTELASICTYTNPCTYTYLYLFLDLAICIHINLNMNLYWHLILLQFHCFTLAISPCLSETSPNREKPGSHHLPFSHLHIQPMYTFTIVVELFIYTPMKQLVS